jgi:hypothetical protein
MLSAYLASPTVVDIAGEPRLVSRLVLSDYALLLSEGSAALGYDLDAGEAPEWSSEEFYEWLTGEGKDVFLWCVLRRNMPALTIAKARAIASSTDDDQIYRAYRAAFRRTSLASKGGGAPDDIASVRWGQIIKHLRRTNSYHAIAGLTLDQVTLEWTKPEDADPAIDAAEHETIEAMQRAWEAIHAPKAPSWEEELKSLNLEIVPDAEIADG